MKAHWQLEQPISAILFDCDGTLTKIEGIDELAKLTNVCEQVKAMTADAMGKTGLNHDLYQARLQLVNPRKEHVAALGEAYIHHQVPDVKAVIQLLTSLNKEIYVISAGLLPAVHYFGQALQVPAANIFAVQIKFDANGSYISFERQSPLVQNQGKREIVAKLKTKHETLAFIGDGLNDYAVHDLVTRFIGYGGVYYRENIAARCQYYIRQASMAAILPLCLTEDEHNKLSAQDKELYAKGLAAILAGDVSV